MKAIEHLQAPRGSGREVLTPNAATSPAHNLAGD